MAGRTGRPRARGPSQSGLTTEQDILKAAARAFTEKGFGSQSTYAICRAAGVRQGAMYHYFPSKNAILLRLLLETVRPSVHFAEKLNRRRESPEALLWALCSFDVGLLAGHEINIGMLLLLPESTNPEFDEFRVERDRLVSIYRDLIGRCPNVPADDLDDLTAMTVALIESVILVRRYDEAVRPEIMTTRVADTVLGLVGSDPARIRSLRAEGTRIRTELTALGTQALQKPG